MRQPGQCLPGAGYLPPASCRKTRPGVKSNTGSTSSLGPTTSRTSASSPTRNGGRLRHKYPATACSRESSRPRDGVPRQPAPQPQPNASPPAVPSAPDLNDSSMQPQRPTSAPPYRPSNSLHTVLGRWGTPEGAEVDHRPKHHNQEETPVANKTNTVKPTPPAAPRPFQPRQGMWIGRSVQLSGCV